ncbi:exosortase B [Massilia sp. IC2-476]|uniref:exosortase B n=1 Tax=Massilia sp. IC2-476 TaxID=2887199 RepID=UPI001D11CD6C|nr:exosortase B [Massilia sp. IC2-476]MCC2972040.1 exosortase B [Massilia sp. IC2-476]
MATAAQNQAAMPEYSAPTLAGTLDALRRSLPEWWPVYAGLAILLGPTFYDLFTGAWIGEEQGHGPIIFFLALWLIWRKWPELNAAVGPTPAGSWAGWPVLAIGLMFHLLGRSQKILMFEVASIVVVMAAVILLKFGSRALRVLWFPFFFMLFLIPLPSELVAAVTMPMKMAVSWVTEHILFALGYPISRSGVVLQMGQYQLLVADACAGLQTLLTLEALGLFYLNLMRHPSAFRNITLAILIIPISFTANVIRVIALTLITYYFGDAAGQGFLHGFAGMVLFITALLLILAVDNGLQWWIKRRESGGSGPGTGGGRRSAPGRGTLKEAT